MIYAKNVVTIIKSQGYDVQLVNGRNGKEGIAFPIEENSPIMATLYTDDFSYETDEEVAKAMISAFLHSAEHNEDVKLAIKGVVEKITTDKAFVTDNLILCVRPVGRKKEGDVVHQWCDLEQYCRVDVGDATVVVTEGILNALEMSAEELFEMAKKKNREVFSAFQFGVDFFGTPSIEKVDRVDFTNGMMVTLSNNNQLYGAGVICDNDLLHSISEQNGNIDLILVPSSIHEIIVLPYDEDAHSFIGEMIESVNSTEVSADEVLSNHAYIYHHYDKVVTCA